MMKTTIEKEISISGFSFVKFSFQSPEKELNQKEIERKINQIFEKGKTFTIEKITEILKTILKDSDKEQLSITFAYNKDNTFKIDYEDGVLTSYTHRIVKTSKEEIEKIWEVKYEKKEMSFSCSPTILENEENIYFGTMEETKKIQKLRNIRARTLSINERRLAKIYQLFFRKNPDFCEKETVEKVKYMIAILKEYELLPFSISEQELENLERIAPLGEIKECNIKLDDETKERIGILGNTIQEHLKETNKDEVTGIRELSTRLTTNIEHQNFKKQGADYNTTNQKELTKSIIFMKKLDINSKKKSCIK